MLLAIRVAVVGANVGSVLRKIWYAVAPETPSQATRSALCTSVTRTFCGIPGPPLPAAPTGMRTIESHAAVPLAAGHGRVES
jgi:hypothetical protein